MERQQLMGSLALRIAGLQQSHPVRVAIDGIDAAGKTTFADELAYEIAGVGRSVIRASVDGFHNPRDTRYRRGRDSPEGYFEDSFDYPALIGGLLAPLGPDGSRRFRRAVFDVTTDRAVDAPLEHASPDAVLLLDGVFLLRPELRSHFEFSIFLRVEFDVSLSRAEARDLDLLGTAGAVRERYRTRYIPGQRLYLSRVDPERWATVVIDNNDLRRPRVVGGRFSAG